MKYPHLTSLFSSLDFDAVDHATLYSFFFGCFHAASLDYPRPLLFIDSEEQGRGKTEVSRALTILLDKKPTSLAMSGNAAADMDNIVAHLLSGCRCISGQNISGVADYNNSFLACLATDGTVSMRGKYDRNATPFAGIVGILSAVYGQASFHPDLVTRAWRVFLSGRAQKLAIQPWLYAKDNRDALIAEILLAHSRATLYTEPHTTRFNHFEAAAAGAYAEFKGCSHPEVAALLKKATDGRLGLLSTAVNSLYKSNPKAFAVPPHTEVIGFTARQFDPDALEGARALGYTFHHGEWTL